MFIFFFTTGSPIHANERSVVCDRFYLWDVGSNNMVFITVLAANTLAPVGASVFAAKTVTFEY